MVRKVIETRAEGANLTPLEMLVWERATGHIISKASNPAAKTRVGKIYTNLSDATMAREMQQAVFDKVMRRNKKGITPEMESRHAERLPVFREKDFTKQERLTSDAINQRIQNLNAKARKLGFNSAEQANLQFNKAEKTAEGKKLLKDYSDLTNDIRNLSDKSLNNIVRDNLNRTLVKLARLEIGNRERIIQEAEIGKRKREEFIDKNLSDKEKKCH